MKVLIVKQQEEEEIEEMNQLMIQDVVSLQAKRKET